MSQTCYIQCRSEINLKQRLVEGYHILIVTLKFWWLIKIGEGNFANFYHNHLLPVIRERRNNATTTTTIISRPLPCKIKLKLQSIEEVRIDKKKSDFCSMTEM